MVLIRIGIESDVDELYNQLSMHPERYFYILIIKGHAVLCVQTCDNCGNNIRDHEIDGLTPDSDGNLVSVFQDDLQDAMIKRELYMKYLEGERYPISQAIRKRIMELPGFIDWIISSAPEKGRCFMLYPSWSI